MLNHYTNGGVASKWTDLSQEAADSGEYPLTGALAALKTYAGTVGPSGTVNTGNFNTGDNANPASQTSINSHLTTNYAAKAGNNGVSFKAADLIMTSTTGAPATITDDGSDGITIGNADASNAYYIKVIDTAVAVYKQGNNTALFEVKDSS